MVLSDEKTEIYENLPRYETHKYGNKTSVCYHQVNQNVFFNSLGEDNSYVGTLKAFFFTRASYVIMLATLRRYKFTNYIRFPVDSSHKRYTSQVHNRHVNKIEEIYTRKLHQKVTLKTPRLFYFFLLRKIATKSLPALLSSISSIFTKRMRKEHFIFQLHYRNNTRIQIIAQKVKKRIHFQ